MEVDKLYIFKKVNEEEILYDNLSPNDKLIFKDESRWINNEETSYVKDMTCMFWSLDKLWYKVIKRPSDCRWSF